MRKLYSSTIVLMISLLIIVNSGNKIRQMNYMRVLEVTRFLAHLIWIISDVLLLSKVRDFTVFCVFYMFGRPNLGGHGRPWEAVLLWLAQTDLTANQGSTASHGLPNSASHGLPLASHGLPRPPKWSASANESLQIGWGRGRPINLGHVRLSEANERVQICEADLRVWSVRPWEADLWGRIRTLWQITWLCGERPCSDSHGLTDQPHRSASHSLTDRPHRSASQIWESDLWGRGRPICEAEFGLSDRSDRFDRSDRSDVP